MFSSPLESKKEGKIRFIGFSAHSVETIKAKVLAGEPIIEQY